MSGMLQNTDETVLRWIAEQLRAEWLDPLVIFYTSLGNGGWAFIAVSALLLLFRRARSGGFAALTGMTLGLLITNLTIKPLAARPRPWIAMENFFSLVTSNDPNSFPSGHTCAAFAFAAALCVMLPQKWAKAAAMIAAALMGLSRLYVGVHFPSDVLVGAVVGTLCGLAGAWIVRRLTDRYRSRKDAE